ncbi:MAG: hypothetical protein KAR36_10590, partial [Candidatus Latescibacteria bacterium]|nr:hypothetical protein [Candidatus Latescibacterota bacterium]
RGREADAWIGMSVFDWSFCSIRALTNGQSIPVDGKMPNVKGQMSKEIPMTECQIGPQLGVPLGPAMGI